MISRRVEPRCSRKANISSITASPVSRSRLPVGSSASSKRGAGAKARARATRCCSPPESWPGRWVRRWPRPTRAQAASARSSAASVAGQLQRDGDVLQRGHGGDEVKGLEDDADAVAAQAGQGVLVRAR